MLVVCFQLAGVGWRGLWSSVGDVVRTLSSFSSFKCTHTHTHTHTFNGPISRTTQVSRYQKGKTNLDFTEARDSEWQWHQLGIRKSAPRSRLITTPAPHHSVFLQAGCPSCHPTNDNNQQRQSTEGTFKAHSNLI